MTFETFDRSDELTPPVLTPTYPTHTKCPTHPQIIKLTQLTHMLISASKKSIELDKSLPTDRMNSILYRGKIFSCKIPYQNYLNFEYFFQRPITWVSDNFS